MSNNKQSSIDWLINEHFGGIENCTPDFRHKIKQAKAMHKDEIKIAYAEGAFEKMRHFDGKEPMLPTEYYNETFNK